MGTTLLEAMTGRQGAPNRYVTPPLEQDLGRLVQLVMSMTKRKGPMDMLPVEPPPRPLEQVLMGAQVQPSDLRDQMRQPDAWNFGALVTKPRRSVWEMTREEFLGKPKITSTASARDLRPRLTKTAARAQPEPFMGDLKIRRGDKSSVVMDGDKPVAMYDGDVLVVDKPYRRRGIGEELTYDFRTNNPDIPPAEFRTRPSQTLQEKVWERIEREAAMRRRR